MERGGTAATAGAQEFRAWSDTYRYNKNAAKAVERGDIVPPYPGTAAYFDWAIRQEHDKLAGWRMFVGDDMEPDAGTPEHEAWVTRWLHDRETLRRLETGEDPLPAPEQRFADKVERRTSTPSSRP